MFQVSDADYDNFMGRYSSGLAPLFADFAGIEAGQRVLDVGAGTGALTAELQRRGAVVAAAEPTPAFAESIERRHPEVELRVAFAEELPWADATFDAALAQLVVAFMRDAHAGLAEMKRVVRPGGVVAACMWDRQGMEMLAAIDRTQTALDPEYSARPQLSSFRTREEVQDLFGSESEAELLEVDATYADYDEFWAAYATTTGAPGAMGSWLSSLDEAGLSAVRRELHRQLGEPDGPFTLVGRAWAVKVNTPDDVQRL